MQKQTISQTIAGGLAVRFVELYQDDRVVVHDVPQAKGMTQSETAFFPWPDFPEKSVEIPAPEANPAYRAEHPLTGEISVGHQAGDHLWDYVLVPARAPGEYAVTIDGRPYRLVVRQHPGGEGLEAQLLEEGEALSHEESDWEFVAEGRVRFGW